MKAYVWVLAVLVAACGGEASDEDAGTVCAEVADQYTDALDEARETEAQIEASKDRIDAALDEATDDED